MLRPTRLTAAQGPITSTRHRRDSAVTNASTVRLSSAFAAGSRDTVTLVSEVDTRSTDSPCSLNTAKASARKPTWCHMPSVSIATSVMPFLMQTALTRAPPSPPVAVITVPCTSGIWVACTEIGMAYCLAGRMQRGCSTFAPLLAISCASS